MIIFLYGTDQYRLSHRLRDFISVASERNGDYNVDVIECGNSTTLENLTASLEVMPFLGEKRLVVFKSLLSGVDAEVAKSFKEVLVSFDRDDLNILVYESGAIDKRRSLCSYLLNDDSITRYEMNELADRELDSHIVSYVEDRGGSISRDAVSNLSFGIGSDLYRLHNELDKLLSYTSRGAISAENVSEIVSLDVSSDIFQLIDYMARGSFTAFVSEYRRLLRNNENEYYIFSMMVYQFRNLALIRSCLDEGMGDSSIASHVKLHPYVVKKSLPLARKFSLEIISRIYGELLELDVLSKTDTLFELKSEIELFTYRFCTSHQQSVSASH